KMWQYGEGKSNFFLFTQLKHNRLSPAELSSYTRTLFKRLGFPAKELSLHIISFTFKGYIGFFSIFSLIM
ncbi:MAG: hypothetical protein LE178_04500, partial [Endomicrobium sp.]|nr:hypothetical protein [Endomicrobium sp.]